MRIVESDELRYQNAALRALGKAAGRGNGAEKEAALKFLLDFYKNKAGSEEVRRLVIEAVGEGALPDASDFLREIIENPQESVTLRSQALAAAGKLGADGADAALRASVIAQLNAAEPLVRAAAVSALGAFPGDESDAALLDALRDPFFRTRLAAVKALSQRKLGAAVDFLVFRAKNDDAAAVREEAVKTLKAYASAQADDGLESIYGERRSGEKIRVLAAEALVQNNAARYTKKLIADMEEAKRAKQKTLYSGLIKALSTSTAPEMAALAEALLTSADTLDRVWAIEIIGNNKLKRFASELRVIADDPKNGLRAKAKTALEKMGQ
jgi:HEAT repeat protein